MQIVINSGVLPNRPAVLPIRPPGGPNAAEAGCLNDNTNNETTEERNNSINK